MSHSSIANPVVRRPQSNLNLNSSANTRRRKLSDNLTGLTSSSPQNCEMALASDSLFDKFGLFAEQANTCHHSGVQDEAVGAIADTGLADFENLDFADLLEIKDEPLIEDFGVDHITDQAMFNMESLVDDASLDSIKSDCMWSSVNLFPTLMDSHINNSSNSNNSRKRRHRDVSLTLSECAEGLLSINQLDVVNMLDQISDDTPLGASPTFLSSSFGASNFAEQNEQNDSCNEQSETETDEDDEIDVVGNSDLGGSSARTRHCDLAINRSNNKKHHLKQQNNEQSRSLLKKQQKPAQTIKTSILDDHCYFLARPQKDIKPLKGMLTPNESSEDEDLFESQTSNFNTAQPTTHHTTTSSMVDKRKIAEAVQSLINNKPHGHHGQNIAGATANPQNNTNIKFKFRMKFKSTQAASNMKKAVNKALTEVNSNTTNNNSSHFGHQEALSTASNSLINRISSTSNSASNSVLSNRQRRKSASKNSYCPTPNNGYRSNNSSPTKQSQKKNNNTTHQHNQSNRTTPASSTDPNSPDSEKCREIRDLHNSMERQRRVEQRNHLAYLKKQVPEVADMEKASKLTILRKAMDYCHLLSNMDSRIRKDQTKEQQRNQMLKKKLLDLTQKHDARRVTGSGRLTGWSQRW